MVEAAHDLAELAEMLTFNRLTAEQLNAWKANMHANHRWFVLGRAIWKTDRWRAIAGPFDNPGDAQRVAERLADSGQRGDRRDLTLAYRTQVRSFAEAMQTYQNDVTLMADDLAEAKGRLFARLRGL